MLVYYIIIVIIIITTRLTLCTVGLGEVRLGVVVHEFSYNDLCGCNAHYDFELMFNT